MIVYGRYAGGNSDEAIIDRDHGPGQRRRRGRELAADGRAAAGSRSDHDVLAKVWARQKIEDLMQQTFYQGSPAVEETVTAIALDYKLMSQYTSFVAVDSSKAADESAAATPPRRMLVPVPLPAGTRWEGFFGGEGESR